MYIMGKLTTRVRKNNNSKTKSMKGGGCGCGISGGKRNNKKSKTSKKKRKVRGGSQHLESLPIRYYYSLNDHSSSLSDVSSAGSSTAQFSGGKKNKKTKTRKQTKGGGIIDTIFNGPQLNVASGFGTNLPYAAHLIGGQTQVAEVINQPAGNLNNEHSPLMV